MTEIIMGLSASVLTGVVALLAVYLTNQGNRKIMALQIYHERCKEEQNLTREKLEELYILASHYCDILFAYRIPYVNSMKGEITYEKARNIAIKSLESAEKDYHRLDMLVKIYFEVLHEDYNKLIQVRDEVDVFFCDYELSCRNEGFEGRKFLAIASVLMKKLTNESDEFVSSIVRVAREQYKLEVDSR